VSCSSGFLISSGDSNLTNPYIFYLYIYIYTHTHTYTHTHLSGVEADVTLLHYIFSSVLSFFMMQFNIIFPSKLRLQNGLFFSRFLTKTLCACLVRPSFLNQRPIELCRFDFDHPVFDTALLLLRMLTPFSCLSSKSEFLAYYTVLDYIHLFAFCWI
jgi:hypothetical protein